MSTTPVVASETTFKPSSYFLPASANETCKILSDHGENAIIVGGGTGIYELSQRGLLCHVKALVDLHNLNLSYVNEGKGLVRIGASTTFSDLGRQKIFIDDKALACIDDALKAINPVQVKNVATIAGAICMSVPFFDLPTALCALDASVVIARGDDKERSEPVPSFLQEMFSVKLGRGEFVREITIPSRNKERRNAEASAFEKFALTADDWAIVNVAAKVSFGSSRNRFREVRVAVGGNVGPTVRIANVVSEKLTDRLATEDNITDASAMVVKSIEPESDVKASAGYRGKLAKVLTNRAISRAVKRAKEGV
jgi:CO/xanthine dehydrogenase FAD-binding subunit